MTDISDQLRGIRCGESELGWIMRMMWNATCGGAEAQLWSRRISIQFFVNLSAAVGLNCGCKLSVSCQNFEGQGG